MPAHLQSKLCYYCRTCLPIRGLEDVIAGGIGTEYTCFLRINVSIKLDFSTQIFRIAFESPRWEIQKGRLKEARATLSRIELINGTRTPERLKLLEDLIQEERQVSP
jgi:hypothetical protein